MIVWLAVAWGGGLTHRATREPMPARELERPVVLPAGWSMLSMEAGADGGRVDARGSLGPALEVRGGLPFAPLGAATVGLGLRLGRGEAPARSTALQVDWRAPALGGDAAHEAWMGLVGRRQWGGLRATLGPELGLRADDGWEAGLGAFGELLLQAGPLGLDGGLRGRWFGDDVGWTRSVGGFVQLNRAVKLGVAHRREDVARTLATLELAL